MQFRLNQGIEVLDKTPSVLSALLQGKSAPWLNARITPDAFSPLDVLGHLIHAEITDWIPRVHLILEHQAKRPFAPFDRFGFKSGKTTDELLNEFAALRREGLHTLR